MTLQMSPSLLDWRFVGLMALAALLRAFVPKRWYLALGLSACVALIGVSSPETLALIGGTALLILYPISLLISRAKSGPEPARAKLWLIVGVVLTVGLWVLFKANKEFRLPFLDGTTAGAKLAALFGFSYFLFKAINFLYMHYLVDLPRRGPQHVLYYSLFLPTLTSGPIQKYVEFSKETDAQRAVTLEDAAQAVYRITKGYFFKVCLASWLTSLSDGLVLASNPTAYYSLAAIASLYLQFFFDFAGYSHIAIGFGMLLGIRVPENFRQPFLATTIAEFWRNWHITIGDWFRDHVFVPLGGMRLGGLRASLLAASIMLACGLWHGLSLPFLYWGIWHASMIFLDGVTGLKPMPPAQRQGPRYWSRILWTNGRIAFGAIFFLPSVDTIKNVLGGFLRWW